MTARVRASNAWMASAPGGHPKSKLALATSNPGLAERGVAHARVRAPAQTQIHRFGIDSVATEPL